MDNFELFYYTGICFMAFLFGITIGSFLNVCIIRLPLGESLIKRNSHCMTCGEKIRNRDLVPIFSWLFLRGKCRNCKSPISPRYAIVEALTGILFVCVFTKFDVMFDGMAYSAMLCLFLCGVIVLSFEDFDTQEMSVSVLIYLTAISAVTQIATLILPRVFKGNNVELTDALIGLFAVSLPLLIIGFVITPIVYKLFLSEDYASARKIIKRLKHERLLPSEKEKLEKALQKHQDNINEQGNVFGFGMGDIFIMAAGGLMLGYKAVIVAAFVAIFVAAIYAIVLKVKNKNSEEKEVAFAFGPFLGAGLVFAAFWGTELFELYYNFLTVPQLVQ